MTSIALLPLVTFPFVQDKGEYYSNLLSVPILARMADSEFSLLAKRITFIGSSFLAFNLFMSGLHRRPTPAIAVLAQ